MRKCTVISLLIILLAVGGAVLVKRCPRTVPLEETSELYQRYADTEGIVASFVQGYRLNDSVRVDVTLLQATDSAAWQQLMDSIWSTIPSREDRDFLMHQSPITTKYIPKGHLNCPMDTASLLNNDLIAIDINQNTVAIFHLDDESQIPAIIRHHLKEVKNNKTTKK